MKGPVVLNVMGECKERTLNGEGLVKIPGTEETPANEDVDCQNDQRSEPGRSRRVRLSLEDRISFADVSRILRGEAVWAASDRGSVP
jgi:hypothetical protein